MLLFVQLPEWLTSEKDLTLATWGLVLATFLLAMLTFVLYLDSRAKGTEQRERWGREDASRAAERQARWQREDQRRIEDAMPKVVVELAKRATDPQINFSCFNLGDTLFFIDQMIVTVTPGTKQIMDLVGPPVVLPGTFVTTPFDCRSLLKNEPQEASAVFALRGSQGTVFSDPVWFRFAPDQLLGEPSYTWEIGRLSENLPGTIPRQPRLIPDSTAEMYGKITVAVLEYNPFSDQTKDGSGIVFDCECFNRGSEPCEISSVILMLTGSEFPEPMRIVQPVPDQFIHTVHPGHRFKANGLSFYVRGVRLSRLKRSEIRIRLVDSLGKEHQNTTIEWVASNKLISERLPDASV